MSAARGGRPPRLPRRPPPPPPLAPSLGHGVVPRLARAAWALVAVAGVAWAAWSGAKHVLFLGVGAPDFARDAAAVNAAALEAFAGLAEGALVALVIAPTCAALFALVFEAILRALVAVAAPRLPRTLAPSAAKTPAERDRRVADLNAARDIHAAFAALKTAAHSACEARQAAASSAIAAWTRPAVMIVLAAASHLAALEASGVPLASALAPGGSLSSARRSRRACGRRGTPARPRRWRRWRPCVAIGARRFDASAREARAREREFLAEAHRGTFSCRWRGDPYVAPGKRNQTSADKALTNAAVAAAAAAAAAARGVPPSAAPALVLDAADGRTSAALRNAFAAGFAVSRDEAGFVTETTYGAGNSVDETFDEEEESASFDDVYGGVEVVVSAPYREGSVAVGGAGISGDPRVAAGGARTPSETSETFPLSSVPLSSEDGIPIPGVSDVSAPALADVSPSSPSPTGSGFPPESIFVPNVHTHAVRSLRGDFPACDAFAADVADVLARRSAGATPFHLVYLDHCGAVAQRAQQIWDVFSRHAVADEASSPPRFPRGANARGGPKRRRWRRARARSSRRRTRTGTNSWEMPRRGAGARRNRTRISRDSWTTPCASSRPGTGADRRRGSRRRPPRRPPRANPSPRLSANTPSPSPPRGRLSPPVRRARGGGRRVRAPRRRRRRRFGGRPRERRGGCGGATRRRSRAVGGGRPGEGERTRRCVGHVGESKEKTHVSVRVRTRRRDERRGARAWGERG